MKRDVFKPILSAILIGLLVGYVIRESINNRIPLDSLALGPSYVMPSIDSSCWSMG